MIQENTFQAKFLTFLVLYVSGSIFCTSYYYEQSVIGTFAVVLLLLIANGGTVVRLKKQKLIILWLLVFFIVLMLFVQGITTFSSYIAITLQLIISLMISEFIDRKVFCSCYVSIMSVLASISLVCYSIYILYPEIALRFPKIEGIASLDYYFAGLHVFTSQRGYGSFVPFYRNSSIFWEPGAYQSFLNVALFFHLYNDDERFGADRKKNIFRLVIFVSAVISTVSTTGYIAMLFTLMVCRKKVDRYIRESNFVYRILLFSLMILFLVAILGKSSSFGFFIDKVNREFGEERGVIARLGLSDFLLFFKDPSFFFGMSFETYYTLTNGTGNSLIQTMLTLGIPFTAILVGMYYRFGLTKIRTGAFFLLVLILVSSESLIWRPFFLCLAWYGIDKRETRERYKRTLT